MKEPREMIREVCYTYNKKLKSYFKRLLFSIVASVFMLSSLNLDTQAADPIHDIYYTQSKGLLKLTVDNTPGNKAVVWTLNYDNHQSYEIHNGAYGTQVAVDTVWINATPTYRFVPDSNGGEHTYKDYVNGNVPIEKWVALYNGGCCHSNDVAKWHTIDFVPARKKPGQKYELEVPCGARYDAGWGAICAVCGEGIGVVDEATGENVWPLIYGQEQCFQNLSYFPVGVIDGYTQGTYYNCPICNHMEQGLDSRHRCTQVSYNKYKVHYNANFTGYNSSVNGTMEDSIHMYENSTTYEGKPVTAQTALSVNKFTRANYEFIGWSTSPTGSVIYNDAQAVKNLCKGDFNVSSSWIYGDKGEITLYAQWALQKSSLSIDPNGGTYRGQTTPYKVEGNYNTTYTVLDSTNTIIPPKGYTVSFNVNGENPVSAITGTQHFVKFNPVGALKGKFNSSTNVFTFTSGGVTDTIKAEYALDPITLPSATKDKCEFDQWYYDSGFTKPAGKAGAKITPTSNITLYAKFIDLRSYLKVDPNGGTYRGSKSAYTQEGVYNTTYKIVDSTKTLTPPSGYRVKFSVNGGNTVADIVQTQSFVKWNPVGTMAGKFDGNNTYTFLSKNQATDTLKAQYAYDKITLPSTTKKYYEFEGWYYDSACTKPAGKSCDKITPDKDMTLYAKWKDLRYPVKTNKLSINAGDGIYKYSTNKYYIRSDGSTPFDVVYSAYIDGEARVDYQQNRAIIEDLNGAASLFTKVNIKNTTSNLASDKNLSTSEYSLSPTTNNFLKANSVKSVNKTNKSATLNLIQQYTFTSDANGKSIILTPHAEIDYIDTVVKSDNTLDASNQITIIADGQGPKILGLDDIKSKIDSNGILTRRTSTQNNSGYRDLNAAISASDALSGVKSIKAEIRNTDNGKTQSYTPDASGIIRINLCQDLELLSGDIELTVTAVDNVGNVTTNVVKATIFDMQVTIENLSNPDNQSEYRRGEIGLLHVKIWGYPSSADVEFPSILADADDELNKHYDYTGSPKFLQEHEIEFIIPVTVDEGDNLEIKVTAHKSKGGKDIQLEAYPQVRVITIAGTVLDDLKSTFK